MSDETRNEDKIRADVEMVLREWGTPGDCDWPPDAAVARLAADVPALLAELSSVRAEAQCSENDAEFGRCVLVTGHDGGHWNASTIRRSQDLRVELAEARRKLADILELGEQLRGPDGNPGSEATAEFFHSVRRLVHTEPATKRVCPGARICGPCNGDNCVQPAIEPATEQPYAAAPAVGETKDGQR